MNIKALGVLALASTMFTTVAMAADVDGAHALYRRHQGL